MPADPTSLANIDPTQNPEAQCASVDDVLAFILRPEVPRDVATMYFDCAKTHGFSIAKDGTSDLYLMRHQESGYRVFVKWQGIERICRRTGLWMPGKSEIRQVANDIYVFASCYARFDRQQTSWQEVQAFVSLASFADRDINGLTTPKEAGAALPTTQTIIEGLKKAQRRGRDWILTPEIILNEIGQYQAALKVFGEFVGQHPYAYMQPRLPLLLDIIENG